jgi:hypothetical protein
MWIRDPDSFGPWIRDLGWKIRIRDSGSGINIPDPQHWYLHRKVKEYL